MNQNDYFFDLNFRVISDALTEQLIDYAQTMEESFIGYQNENRLNGELLIIENLENFPELMILKHNILVDNLLFSIYKQKIDSQRTIHKDTSIRRTTVLATPLIPKKNFSSTNFYLTNQESSLCFTKDWSNQNSCFLNTKKYHSVMPVLETRLNFQIGLKLPLSQIISLIQENKFFRNNLTNE